MSAADLTAGYRAAGGGKANIIDLTAAASAVAKHGLEQAELTRTRQEEFDKNRADFKAKMQESYDKFVYEDKFDDTGILELDSAGEKLRNQIKASYLQTEWEYNNGLIDEATVRSRNNNIKGQVNEFANLTGDIIKWGEEKAKLEAEGKDNRLNDFRGDLLEAYSKQFKVKSTGAGLVMSTVIDGKEVDVPASQFKRVMQTDQAVDIEKDLDDLVELGGLEEKIQGWGRDAKKITDYTRGEEAKSLIKTRVDQWSAAETMDYALKMGLVTDDPDDKSKPYLGLDAVFADDVQDDIKEAVYKSMAEELDNRLQFKQKKEIYNDTFALAATKQAYARENRRKEKQVLKSADLKVTDEISGDKRNVREFYPTNGKGIELSYVVQDPGNNMSRAFADSIEGVAGHPVPLNAIKSTKYMKERIDMSTGKIEVTLGYDFQQTEEEIYEQINGFTDEQYSDYIDGIVKMHNQNVANNNRSRTVDTGRKDEAGNPITRTESGSGGQIIDAATAEEMKQNRQRGISFATTQMPKEGSGTFKYVPRTLSEYNVILSATGRQPMSNTEWDQFFIAKQANKVKSQAYSKHNKGSSSTPVAPTTTASATTGTVGTQTRNQ